MMIGMIFLLPLLCALAFLTLLQYSLSHVECSLAKLLITSKPPKIYTQKPIVASSYLEGMISVKCFSQGMKKELRDKLGAPFLICVYLILAVLLREVEIVVGFFDNII